MILALLRTKGLSQQYWLSNLEGYTFASSVDIVTDEVLSDRA